MGILITRKKKNLIFFSYTPSIELYIDSKIKMMKIIGLSILSRRGGRGRGRGFPPER